MWWLILVADAFVVVPHVPSVRTRAQGDDEVFEPMEPRLAPKEETLAAAALGTSLAAVAGLEILDAGVVGSSLLVGAALAWAAENDKEYGIGDVARGIGKLGWKAYKAASKAPDATEEVAKQASEAKDSFTERLNAIRQGIQEDRVRFETRPDEGK